MADVAPRSQATVYGHVGDLFAWLCLTGFVTIIVSALSNRRRRTGPLSRS